MKQFFEIRKVDAEARMVWGYASTGSVDSQGETVTKAAMEAAWDDYMQFGNIREMHTASAVGVVKEYAFDDNGVQIGAYIVDDMAWKKVVEEVYKGFSIGGKKVPGGYDAITKTITALKLTEISLVDRPANPEALITMWKADSLEVEDMGTKAGNTAPVDKLAELLNKGAISPERLVELADADIIKCSAAQPVETTGIVADATADAQTEASPKVEEVGKADAPIAVLVATREGFKALAIAKDASPEDIKKGLYTVSDLAQLICSLRWIQSDCAYEAQAEGDNSSVPAQIVAGVKTLCAALVAMAQEECAELLEGMGGATDDPVVVLGKMLDASASAEQLKKYTDAFDILKSGARNSKTDSDRIQKAHDLLSKLGASCEVADDTAAKLHKASENGSIQKALGDFEKMAGEFNTLRKDFATLQNDHDVLRKKYDATPTEPKGVSLIVAKSEEATSAAQASSENVVSAVLKQDGTVDDVATAIKKVHAGGGRPLFRS